METEEARPVGTEDKGTTAGEKANIYRILGWFEQGQPYRIQERADISNFGWGFR